MCRDEEIVETADDIRQEVFDLLDADPEFTGEEVAAIAEACKQAAAIVMIKLANRSAGDGCGYSGGTEKVSFTIEMPG